MMYSGLASQGSMYKALLDKNPIQPKDTKAHPSDQPCGLEGLLIAKTFTKKRGKEKSNTNDYD